MASTSLEYLVTLHEYVKQSGGKTFQCYVKGGFIAGGSFFCNLQVWLHLDNVFFPTIDTKLFISSDPKLVAYLIVIWVTSYVNQ